MRNLAAQRCFNHVTREAVARCVDCRHFFCRECASDHDGRVICATCLAKHARKSQRASGIFSAIFFFAQCVVAALAAWLFFHLLGEGLLAIPSDFHEGSIWKKSTEESE